MNQVSGKELLRYLRRLKILLRRSWAERELLYVRNKPAHAQAEKKGYIVEGKDYLDAKGLRQVGMWVLTDDGFAILRQMRGDFKPKRKPDWTMSSW